MNVICSQDAILKHEFVTVYCKSHKHASNNLIEYNGKAIRNFYGKCHAFQLKMAMLAKSHDDDDDDEFLFHRVEIKIIEK